MEELTEVLREISNRLAALESVCIETRAAVDDLRTSVIDQANRQGLEARHMSKRVQELDVERARHEKRLAQLEAAAAE